MGGALFGSTQQSQNPANNAFGFPSVSQQSQTSAFGVQAGNSLQATNATQQRPGTPGAFGFTTSNQQTHNSHPFGFQSENQQQQAPSFSFGFQSSNQQKTFGFQHCLQPANEQNQSTPFGPQSNQLGAASIPLGFQFANQHTTSNVFCSGTSGFGQISSSQAPGQK